MSLWSKLFGERRKFTDDASQLIQKNIADGKAIMLDVRSQEERDAGFLKGSVFIPITSIKSLPANAGEVAELDKSNIIYIH